MKKRKKSSYAFAGALILALIALGLLVDSIGNVGVRLTTTPPKVRMTVSDPLVPGQSPVLRWEAEGGVPSLPIVVRLRTSSGAYDIASGTIDEGSLVATMPCIESGNPARIEMALEEDGQVVSILPVHVLAPGPDCVK